MKKIISVVMIVCMLALLPSCAQKRDFGDSAKYEKGTAYVVSNIKTDNVNAVAADVEADSYVYWNDFRDTGTAVQTRTVSFGGADYQTEFKKSYLTVYQTVVDVYSTTGGEEINFEINRDNGKLVAVVFNSRLFGGSARGGASTESEYIEAAKQASEKLIDVSDYTVRYEAPKSGETTREVYFEKFVDGYLLTRTYVSLLNGGEVYSIRTEADYDWNAVKGLSIGSAVDGQVADKLRSVCAAKSVTYAGYETSFTRIVPDKNGRLAVLYMVYPNEPGDSPKCINPLNILIYIE